MTHSYEVFAHDCFQYAKRLWKTHAQKNQDGKAVWKKHRYVLLMVYKPFVEDYFSFLESSVSGTSDPMKRLIALSEFQMKWRINLEKKTDSTEVDYRNSLPPARLLIENNDELLLLSQGLIEDHYEHGYLPILINLHAPFDSVKKSVEDLFKEGKKYLTEKNTDIAQQAFDPIAQYVEWEKCYQPRVEEIDIDILHQYSLGKGVMDLLNFRLGPEKVQAMSVEKRNSHRIKLWKRLNEQLYPFVDPWENGKAFWLNHPHARPGIHPGTKKEKNKKD